MNKIIKIIGCYTIISFALIGFKYMYERVVNNV